LSQSVWAQPGRASRAPEYSEVNSMTPSLTAKSGSHRITSIGRLEALHDLPAPSLFDGAGYDRDFPRRMKETIY